MAEFGDDCVKKGTKGVCFHKYTMPGMFCDAAKCPFEKKKELTYNDLINLSIKELETIREYKRVEYSKKQEAKQELVGNILTLQGLIYDGDS